MTSRELRTAEAQLERILYILPAAARDGGASVAALARELGVEPKQVFGDLTEATARSFHHPGGTVDPFTIFFTRTRVRVEAHEHFLHPTRLSDREAVALGLGLRVLASDVSPERRDEILALARRLEAALCAPDYSPGGGSAAGHNVDADGVEYDSEGLEVVLGSDSFRGQFGEAIDTRVLCEFSYLKAGGEAPEWRRIAPYRLVYADGIWYVAGLDVQRDDLRFFRMDRVLDVRLCSDDAPPPPDHFDEWVAGAPYRAENEEQVVVAYDATVAPWVCEATGVRPEADGSVLLTHSVADRRWIVRHVLQYGGAAVVREPRDVAYRVAAAVEHWIRDRGGADHREEGMIA